MLIQRPSGYLKVFKARKTGLAILENDFEFVLYHSSLHEMGFSSNADTQVYLAPRSSRWLERPTNARQISPHRLDSGPKETTQTRESRRQNNDKAKKRVKWITF